MQFTTNTVTLVQPMTVTVTLETADDYRWFYHLMNFQNKEIQAGYSASSKGSFDSRFTDFALPDKKALFKAVKATMVEQGISA